MATTRSSGVGNDVIEDLRNGNDNLSGGDGDDIIRVEHGYGANILTIDGGAGQ